MSENEKEIRELCKSLSNFITYILDDPLIPDLLKISLCKVLLDRVRGNNGFI